MGYGNYSYDAHLALTQARSGQDASAIFSSRVVHPSMDPKGVKYRESRDSADNPSSLGIVFALDISGSMAEIPVQIATGQLPSFMKLLTDCAVSSPQVLFMALTDVVNDGRPLQVGQFETTAELMDQWLTRCSLQGGGDELYELAIHFAARHTAMDCWEKRQKRGYLFVTGDEPANATLSRSIVERFLGEAVEDKSLADVIEDASRTFNVFFLAPDPTRAANVRNFWHPYLGENFVALASPADTCAAAAALVALGEGAVAGLDALEQRLLAAGLTPERAKAVVGAVRPWAASRNGR